MALRYGRVKWGPHGERVRTAPANWRQPLKWNREAEKTGTATRVFCASLADVFDNQVPPEWREDLFDLIRITPNLVWLLLTKRPQNIVRMIQSSGAIAGNGTRYLPGNTALGTTIEDQKRAEINVPHLLFAKEQLGPKFIFVSCEPLLGKLNLTRMPLGGGWYDALGGRDVKIRFPGFEQTIDWVIAGGETDQGKHKARAADPNWFRWLRNQCAEAGIPFHFKQWGEFAPNWLNDDAGGKIDSSEWMDRIGKRSTGRLLDGVEYNGFPGEAVPR